MNYTTEECTNDSRYGATNRCCHINKEDDFICDKTECIYDPSRGYHEDE